MGSSHWLKLPEILTSSADSFHANWTVPSGWIHLDADRGLDQGTSLRSRVAGQGIESTHLGATVRGRRPRHGAYAKGWQAEARYMPRGAAVRVRRPRYGIHLVVCTPTGTHPPPLDLGVVRPMLCMGLSVLTCYPSVRRSWRWRVLG